MSAAMQPGGIEAEALALWQEPSIKTRREWRWRKRGSLSLVISGPKRGVWYDHESGQGGRLGQGEATSRRREASGLPNGRKTKDEAKRIETARRLWEASEPVAATLGERYLVGTRGVQRPADGWSEAVRYHRESRSLILAATLADGTVQAVHVIRLTPDAQNAKRRDGSKIKLSYGPLAGAMVRLPALSIGSIASAPLLLAEGAETGLSLWTSTGHETWIALGSLARLESPGVRTIVVCRDDDPSDSPASRRLDAALENWPPVAVATPWPEPRGDKSDFNDLLREAGPEAVRHRIRVALLGAIGLTPCEPPFPLPTAAPDAVLAATLHAVRTFFLQRSLTPPPRMVVPGQTGSGKTRAVGMLLPHIILADKAERELPGREKAPYRAVVMVPAHRLGRQWISRFAAEFESHGLSVAVLEGRGDPWKAPKPGARSYLCKNLEAVGLALQAHQDVKSAVCGTKNGKHCPFFDGCGYLAQFAAARTADVLIVAHNFLFERLPKSVLHDVAYVVVDEDFTATADAISELSIDTLRSAALNTWPALRDGEEDTEAQAELVELSGKLVEVLDKAEDGYLPEGATMRPGQTRDSNYLRHLHWKRRRDVGMHPGMTLDARREALRAAVINQQLPRIATLLRMLAAGEASRIRLFTDREARRGMVLHGQRQPAAWLADKPVLMLNATARLADVRRTFPDATMASLPQAKLDHQHVHQVLGAFGKSAMQPGSRKLTELVVRARDHVARGKSVLVITHDQCEAEFRAVPGVRTLHHGDLAGDDDHGDVDVIMQTGGPFAPYRKVAELATARSGEAVSIAKPVRRPCAALMADGSGVRFERMAYEHPAAQAVHEGIYDAGFVQGGLGRGRGINRTAATPLMIEIYGNVPLPVPLASLIRWQSNRELHLLAAGGTHSNARDLYRFCGDEFPSEEAAARWRQRNPYDEGRIRQHLAGDVRPFVRVTWQPIGQGHKLRRSTIPAAEEPAFRRRAERAFSGLLSWTIEPFTPGARKPGEDMDIRFEGLQSEMSDSSPQMADAAWRATRGQAQTWVHPPDG